MRIHILLMVMAVFVGAPICAHAQQSGQEIQVIPVRGNIFLLAGAGGNITVQTGEQGIFVVDAGTVQLSDQILAAIRKLSRRPIRYIVNTGMDADHIGGNEKLRSAGITVAGALFQGNFLDATPNAQIIAHENTFNRMSGLTGGRTTISPEAWPQDNYPGELKRLYFNDEGIEMIHVAAAHTDGDSIVFFRRSDVVSAGDIFSTISYPVIDLQKGGGVQGIIDGLNRILDITIAAQEVEGGTYVIPGHGRICDQFDVLEYRDMVSIIRDRVQAMIRKGLTLEQIKAAHPTDDYDARYGATSGSWTTDMFVEAVYKSLAGKK